MHNTPQHSNPYLCNLLLTPTTRPLLQTFLKSPCTTFCSYKGDTAGLNYGDASQIIADLIDGRDKEFTEAKEALKAHGVTDEQLAELDKATAMSMLALLKEGEETEV